MAYSQILILHISAQPAPPHLHFNPLRCSCFTIHGALSVLFLPSTPPLGALKASAEQGAIES